MATKNKILGCMQTMPKIIWWKIRYGKRFSASWKSIIKRNAEIILSSTAKVRLGKKIVAMSGLSLSCSGEIVIGDGCFFNKNCSITSVEKITIGDGCTFANNIVIVDHDHDYKNDLKKFITSPVKIGNHVWIGANSVILRGVEIGDYSVIAAGSVVRKNVPTHTLYYEKRSENYRTREK